MRPLRVEYITLTFPCRVDLSGYNTLRAAIQKKIKFFYWIAPACKRRKPRNDGLTGVSSYLSSIENIFGLILTEFKTLLYTP